MSISKDFHKVRSLIIGLLLVVLGTVIGFRFGRGENVPFLSQIANQIPAISQMTRVQSQSVPADFSSVDFAQFWEVWRRLERDYVDPEKLDAKKMVYGAIQGMTSALGDPYTLYLPPEDQKRSTEDLSGSFEGVGISLGYKNNTLAAMSVLPNNAAEKAGVQSGDYITHITDKLANVDRDTTGMTLPEAVSVIRGKKGTSVTLTFYREGGKEEEKTLVRDTIVIPSVELTYVDSGKNDGKKAAHLKLNQFGDRTDTEWNTAVQDILLQRNLSGIVLDVRNNPGGYLQEAIAIGSEFIKDGVIVSQQSKTEKQDYKVSRVVDY
jgi:carboxyl-terminal processing protease